MLLLDCLFVWIFYGSKVLAHEDMVLPWGGKWQTRKAYRLRNRTLQGLKILGCSHETGRAA